jgi:hypothetical protein
MPTPEQSDPAEVANALKVAAREVREADERRENRELIRVLVLGFIVGLPSVIGAFASVIGAMHGQQAAIQGQKTHDLVNSRMTELLEEVSKAQRAQGILEGKASK